MSGVVDKSVPMSKKILIYSEIYLFLTCHHSLFHRGSGDTNLGPYTFMTDALLTNTYPQLINFDFTVLITILCIEF